MRGFLWFQDLFRLAADFLHGVAFAGDGSDDGRRGDVTVAVDVNVLLPEADVGSGAVDGVDRAAHLRGAVLTVHALDLEVVAVQHRAVQLLLFRLRAALTGATATAAALAMQVLRRFLHGPGHDDQQHSDHNQI